MVIFQVAMLIYQRVLCCLGLCLKLWFFWFSTSKKHHLSHGQRTCLVPQVGCPKNRAQRTRWSSLCSIEKLLFLAWVNTPCSDTPIFNIHWLHPYLGWLNHVKSLSFIVQSLCLMAKTFGELNPSETDGHISFWWKNIPSKKCQQQWKIHQNRYFHDSPCL